MKLFPLIVNPNRINRPTACDTDGPSATLVREWIFGPYGPTTHYISATVNALSGMTASGMITSAITAQIDALSAMTGAAAAIYRGLGTINALSGMTADGNLYRLLNAQIDALSGMSGDLTVSGGMTYISATITAISRMYELFRYLNPVYADSIISTAASYASGMSTSLAYDSAIVLGASGASQIGDNYTYASIISTQVTI